MHQRHIHQQHQNLVQHLIQLLLTKQQPLLLLVDQMLKIML